MFDFPRTTRPKGFRYQHTFLQSVVFQVKYPPVADIRRYASDLDAVYLREYPVRSDLVSGEVSVELGKTPVLVRQQTGVGGVEYRSTDGNHVISVTADAISQTILGTAYTTFEEMSPGFLERMNQTGKILALERLVRVAIRKINIFQFVVEPLTSPASFLPVILNQSLATSLSSAASGKYLESGITRMDFKDEPFQLKLAYGILPQMQGNAHLATLDIDLFNGTRPTSLGDAGAEFRGINEVIFDVFEYCTSDNVKNVMQRGN